MRRDICIRCAFKALPVAAIAGSKTTSTAIMLERILLAFQLQYRTTVPLRIGFPILDTESEPITFTLPLAIRSISVMEQIYLPISVPTKMVSVDRQVRRGTLERMNSSALLPCR